MQAGREVYVLRHEQRGEDQTFLSRLTAEGSARAGGELCADLLRLGVRTVYCSPFLRAVETVAPYCVASGVPIRVEWGLCELLASRQHSAVPEDTGPAPYPSETYGSRLAEYTSAVAPERLQARESLRSMQQRVADFASVLINDPTFADQSPILLVTHMHVCNALIQLQNPEYDIKQSYPQGQITKVVLRQR